MSKNYKQFIIKNSVYFFFFIFQHLQRKKDLNKPKRSADSEDDQPDDVLDSQAGQMTVTNDWWREFVLPEDLATLMTSNKLRILCEILKLCAENNEKW